MTRTGSESSVAPSGPRGAGSFGEWDGAEPEPTEVKGLGMGPAIIGPKQHAFNQRHIRERGGGSNGPAIQFTPQEYEAWENAGKPVNWYAWRDKYQERVKNLAIARQHKKGADGQADVVTG